MTNKQVWNLHGNKITIYNILNTKNLTIMIDMEDTHGNNTSFTVCVIHKAIVCNNNFLGLSVNFHEFSSLNKHIAPRGYRKNLSDKEILISRLIDRLIRPMLQSLIGKYEIETHIYLTEHKHGFDYQVGAIMALLITMRYLWPIQCGVSSLVIDKKQEIHYMKSYISKLHPTKILLGGTRTHDYLLSLTSTGISSANMLIHMDKLRVINQDFSDLLCTIESHYKDHNLIVSNGDIVEIKAHEQIYNNKRQDLRKTNTPRSLELITSSANTLTLARGDTIVMSQLTKFQQSNYQFKHIYLCNGFACGQMGKSHRLSRREVGHNDLITKSLSPIINKIKLKKREGLFAISNVLQANGSTSMCATMATSLHLLKQGLIDINNFIYGISMGLVHHNKDSKLLIDMTEYEDSISDMDLKITGTMDHIFAVQMDVKRPISIIIWPQIATQYIISFKKFKTFMDNYVPVYVPKTIKVDNKKTKKSLKIVKDTPNTKTSMSEKKNSDNVKLQDQLGHTVESFVNNGKKIIEIYTVVIKLMSFIGYVV